MSVRVLSRLVRGHILLAILLLTAGPRPALAASDGAVRIALSVRQAALVETMTASACFAMGGVDTQRQKGAALEGLDRYQTVLTGFRDGHQFLYLDPLPADADDGTLMWAGEVWVPFSKSLRQIIAGDLHTVVMRHVIMGSEETVLTAIAVASETMKAFGADVMEGGSLPALRLVGHLQLLTQRALRQACFVHFGLGGAATLAGLGDTLAEIRATYARLQGEGDAPVEVPNARIARNIKTSALLWARVLPVIEGVQAGASPEEVEFTKMLKMNASVVKQLSQAIDGFVQ